MGRLLNTKSVYIVTINEQFNDIAIAIIIGSGKTSARKRVMIFSPVGLRWIEGELISETDDSARVKLADKEVDIRPLTLQAYNAIKKQLEDPPDFASEQEMLDFYHTTYHIEETSWRKRAENTP